MLEKQDRAVAARPEYSELLAMREQLSGSEQTNALSSLNTIAEFLENRGMLAEAETTRRQVLTARQRLRGNQYDELAHSYRSLALLLEKEDKTSEAEEMHREALAVSKKLPTLGLTCVSHFHRELAAVLEKQGRHAEADDVYREWVQNLRARLKVDDPELAAALAMRAEIMLRIKRFTDAEPVLRECLAIREKRTPDEWRTFNARSMLGRQSAGAEEIL